MDLLPAEMSGEASRRKNKGNAAAAIKPRNALFSEDATSSTSKGGGSRPASRVQEESGSGCGSGCSLSKMIFYLLLSVFLLVATVNYVDYQNGQLKEAYVKTVPKEVSEPGK